MSRVFFCADLHFGHEKVHMLRTEFSSEINVCMENINYMPVSWEELILRRLKRSISY
jgi:calcineurin-like phosphoesterase family protein